MGILISQTYAQLGLERIPGKLEIQTNRARLELRRFNASLNARTERPVIEIDQHDAFASAGLKSIGELSQEAAKLGYEQAMAYIAQTAQEGDRFAAIQTGENVVANLASEHSTQYYDFNVAAMPSEPVHFNARPWKVVFDPDPVNDGNMVNGIEGEYIPGDIQFNYTPAAIKAYMLQQAAVRISYSGSLDYNWTTLNTYI